MVKPETRSENLPIIHAGFIPLTDCASLIIAKEMGFDSAYGFSLRLHREVSWANIRDKTEHGIFDCAHMLAPMPIACTLGLGRTPVPMIAPMALNLNGNAITVSEALYQEMCRADETATLAGGMDAAKALAKVVEMRRASGAAPMTLGMVYPFSCHNYDLRYWLAAAGIHPDEDVRIIVVPPPLIAESLEAGQVDGFCVGAPWSSFAVERGYGRIIATKHELWSNSPEKVLGVRLDWAEQNEDLLLALMQALLKACQWLDQPDNRAEMATILARADYIGVAEPILQLALTGKMRRAQNGPTEITPDFLVFHRHAANFPWISHGIWLLTQMQRWGQTSGEIDLKAVAAQIFRPDLYRRAASPLGIETPGIEMKAEGQSIAPQTVPGIAGSITLGESRFFGNEKFDPDQLANYTRSFLLHTDAQ